MANTRKIFLSIAGVVVLSIAAGVWAWEETWDRELSEKPERSAGSLSIPSVPSSFQASVALPVAAVTDAINKAVPATFSISVRQKVCAKLTEQIKQTIQKKIGGDVGKFVGEVAKIVTEVVTVNQTREVCQDVDYHVDINRAGNIQLAPTGKYLHIALPISASGQAGFTGDVAKALALDKKNFRGALNAFADISLDIDPDWCPLLTESAGFNWTSKAEFEIAHNWWINIDGQVGPKINEMIQKAITDLKTKIKCDDVKAAVMPFWHPYSLPVSIPGDTGPAAYLMLNPIKVGFSGIQYGTDALRAALGIEATTEVSTTSPPVNPKPGGLPRLNHIAATSNRVAIAVPVRVGYDDAVAASSRLLRDTTFEAPTPVGNVKLHVSEVSVYPSGGRLVIGMHFVASVSSRLLDTSGWVYLVAEPSLDGTNQVVRLRNVTFTRQLDNDLWSVLSAIFSDQVKKFIEEKAIYDLKPDIAKLRSNIRQKLVELEAQQKLSISLKDDFAGLKQVNLAETALEVVIGFEGTANIAVDAIKIGIK